MSRPNWTGRKVRGRIFQCAIAPQRGMQFPHDWHAGSQASRRVFVAYVRHDKHGVPNDHPELTRRNSKNRNQGPQASCRAHEVLLRPSRTALKSTRPQSQSIGVCSVDWPACVRAQRRAASAQPASSFSMAAIRSSVLGWLRSHAGTAAPRAPVSLSSFLNSDFCGSVPIPDLTSKAEA